MYEGGKTYKIESPIEKVRLLNISIVNRFQFFK